MQKIIVIGGNGAIGRALVEQLSVQYPEAHITAIARTAMTHFSSSVTTFCMDYQSESSLQETAKHLSKQGPYHLIFVATGVLHTKDMMPEKSIREVCTKNLTTSFQANTIFPAMVGKYFLPLLDKKAASMFAVLSARVGSISDNRLGGRTAYRASKTALNMIIKNYAIEMARTHKQAVIVSLHPGTVESPLSQPFLKHVSTQVSSPMDAAKQLINVLTTLTPEQSGGCFAWDGEEILP